jgi:UDP-N-acetylmuramate dehydrogenase
MEFLQNQPLQSHTTMKLGGPAKYLCVAQSNQDVVDAVNFANQKSLPIMVLGGGSNIIFSDSGFNGLVIVNSIDGLSINSLDKKMACGAGVIWDDAVKASVDAGLSGIEALSLIPGTIGGSPVNNIGAYGQEVSQTIESIDAYDLKTNEFVKLSNQHCNFSYRSSLFKTDEYGRYIIVKVTMQLKDAKNYTAPTYASLQSALGKAGITDPTIQDIRNTVIAIRSDKLPDPRIIPNTGSFFKNPIVSNQKRDELLAIYPNLVYFEFKDKTKLAAGWLIDNAGLKGYEKDGIQIYEKQALVLVNIGTRSYQALDNMKTYIQNVVKEKYGVDLEVEPELK